MGSKKVAKFNMENDKLNEKQRTFCKEYIIDLNATQAAIRAGYSEKTANRIGSENLSKLDIQNEIQRLKQERTKRVEVTADRVLLEVSKLSYFNIKNLYNEDGSLKNVTDLDDDTAAAIASVDIYEDYGFDKGTRTLLGITKKIKPHNKLQALELLARHLGMFNNDKLKVDLQASFQKLEVEIIDGHLKPAESEKDVDL